MGGRMCTELWENILDDANEFRLVPAHWIAKLRGYL